MPLPATTPLIPEWLPVVDGAGLAEPDCFARRFQRVVTSLGSQCALDSGGQAYSFRDLDRLSGLVAAALAAETGPGDSVALCLTQGVDTVVTAIAALKSGRAFVPIDPTFPAERQQAILVDCGAKLVVTARARAVALAAANRGFEGRQVILEELLAGGLPDLRHPPVPPTSPALVLYVSDSTGRPRGVVWPHASLLANVHRHVVVLGISSRDRQSLLYQAGVYGGIRDMLNALLTGATLCHFPLHEKGFTGLADWLDSKSVSVFCTVPTVLLHFAGTLPSRRRFEALRLVSLIGREPVGREHLACFRQLAGAGTVLFSGMGTSETGLACAQPLPRDLDLGSSVAPLGLPAPGMDVTLLDDSSREVGPDKVGELCVESHYMAHGYHDRPDETARAFEHRADGKVAFRPGDLALRRSDGSLVHQGRTDDQVMIRGNRVQLGEVERALLSLPGVVEAVVISAPDPEGGPRLVAYVVSSAELTPGVLRVHLARRLPDAMIPSLFVPVSQMPRNAAGRVDRAQLAERTRSTIAR